MAYFNEKTNKIELSDSEKDTFAECARWNSMPKEKRPKPNLLIWLEDSIDSKI